jgi:amino-acid N-acetyltransferase
MGQAVTIGTFSAEDKHEVLNLLSGAQLPIEDLSNQKMKDFLVAKGPADDIIGVAGVELYPEKGLLRSLAVAPAYRGKGLGCRLTREMESFARQKGIQTLYLLTTTAADFFLKLGYEVMQRHKVPPPVQQADEFKSVCPVSAVCLFKALDLWS